MSALRNSSFESGVIAPWARMNFPNATQMNLINDPAVARSGANYLVLNTNQAGGSIAQDIPFASPSITAMAYVRSSAARPVNGKLAIWDLRAVANITTTFSVNNAWELVVAVKDLSV